MRDRSSRTGDLNEVAELGEVVGAVPWEAAPIRAFAGALVLSVEMFDAFGVADVWGRATVLPAMSRTSSDMRVRSSGSGMASATGTWRFSSMCRTGASGRWLFR